MALDFDWSLFEQAHDRKNRNQQQMDQNMATLGQTLGGTVSNILEAKRAQKKKEQWDKTINSMMVDPNTPRQAKAILPLVAQNPGSWELLSSAMKPPAPTVNLGFGPEGAILAGPPGKPPPGSPAGQPSIPVKPDTAARILSSQIAAKNKPPPGSAMAGVRQTQFTLQDLPSNQPPTTAGGAAYQVKVAARQGKNLIAKAGSSQRLGLAAGDLARAVLRASPTDEAMHNANFSDNTINRWNQLKQQITSDPTAVNNPKIRKEIYSIFDEMDKSASPFISMQLDNMEDAGFKVSPGTRKREMGETLPDIPFIETPDQGSAAPSAGGWGIVKH